MGYRLPRASVHVRKGHILANVTNTSTDDVHIPLYGLHFAPGEEKLIDDDIAATLPAFFKRTVVPVAPVAIEPVVPVAPVAIEPVAVETPAAALDAAAADIIRARTELAHTAPVAASEG